MKKYILQRIAYFDKQTLGYFLDENRKRICFTLELAWKDNARNISCIPTGVYTVVRRVSPARGQHFHITDVQGRTSILIHSGNYHTDIQGCVLVGKTFSDINKDGYCDVTSSVATMNDLLKILPTTFSLEIIGEPIYPLITV